MDLLLEAEARKPGWTRCVLVRVDLPDGPACWTDGGFAAFDAGDGAQNFYSDHPLYGSLDNVPSGMGSNSGGQNTRVDLTFLPRDDDAMAVLASPLNQGSRVRVWYGAVGRTDGLLVGAPLLRFDGVLDTPQAQIGASWSLTWECGTEADLQLEPNADWRLNHALQAKIWLNDNGLANVTNVVNATRNMEWRT